MRAGEGDGETVSKTNIDQDNQISFVGVVLLRLNSGLQTHVDTQQNTLGFEAIQVSFQIPGDGFYVHRRLRRRASLINPDPIT